MPVLDDDGFVVADSLQIIRHLERRHPEPPLLPAGDPHRAEVELFLDWFDRVWKVAPNAIEGELASERPDERRIASLAAERDRALDRFEALLGGRRHLVGDDFSAADCAAFPTFPGHARRAMAWRLRGARGTCPGCGGTRADVCRDARDPPAAADPRVGSLP